MKEDKGVVKPTAGNETESVVENGKKKNKEEKPATKVVVRRLPPSMTEEQFKTQVSPLPEIDYFYFVPADISLAPNAFTRAYINFVDQSDLFIFTQKFDGYVFVDSKGGEFPAIVEFAPFQRIPKIRPNRKKDPKVGTIETDSIFISFKERIEAESLETKTAANVSKQHFFETSLVPEKKEINNTPLLDYIKNRKAEKQRIRDEKREEKRKRDLERKRAKEEQRRIKIDEDTSVVKVLNSPNTNKDRGKEKELKPGFIKKKSDEGRIEKEKPGLELRTKESKTRTGKSYFEERQRQAERREVQRKKLSQSQGSSSILETKHVPDDKADDISSEDKVPENRVENSEYKKPERPFKREEIRKTASRYASADKSKRDRESDDARRTRRTNNERSYQSNRRDDERTEDGGRRRYSESRRSNDSTQRERYKDKDKNKVYGQKNKNPESISEFDKGTLEKPLKSSDSDKLIDENSETKNYSVKDVNYVPDDQVCRADNNDSKVSIQSEKSVSELGARPKVYESKDKIKPNRRKSFDYDKNRNSSANTSSKSYSREKYYEKKRRNSVGSNKQNQENIDIRNNQDDIKVAHNNNKDEPASKDQVQKRESEHTKFEVLNINDKICVNNEIDEESIPKRRNSTGDRDSPQKISPRRNSLGSEDKSKEYVFKEPHYDSQKSSKDYENKNDSKTRQNRQDPRSERRIRNKDRPSIEIYRPGMGKFSKQRLEREKGLGSSTEVESPSSSPSPTPVLKHKTVTPLY